MRKLILFLVVALFSGSIFANVTDDTLQTNEPYMHSRKRAVILSAFIPGAGQIYNEIGYRKFQQKKHRAWWKVPLIYGGLTACGYYFYQNNKFANLTKQEWLFQKENPGSFLDERFINYPTDPTGFTPPNTLINGYTDEEGVFHKGFDIYAKRRDLFIFGFIGVWALNVVEAYVDAHFVTFDVSEDLSLSWHPTLLLNKPAVSLTLNIN